MKKITVVSVSVPAVRQVRSFYQRYRERYPQDPLEITCFYIAGTEQDYLLHPEAITEAIEGADAAVVDTMGAPEALQELCGAALEKCCGQRIVIGNTLREYLRLGAFSMGAMRRKNPAAAQRKTGLAEAAETSSEAPGGSAAEKMHRMRRMSLMLGNVIPFGITRDMKNIFLLIDYWQQATQEDIESFMYLLLRRYGKRKFLPKEKPCTLRYGIYLKDPFTLDCGETIAQYKKRAGFDPGRDTVAVLFYGHSYPNDFLPVVRAVCTELKKDHNLLPVAFSQNEDDDLEKLRAYLNDSCTPVSAVVNLMPFRLGAGPMGGDAERAVRILTETDVPYFKPFCLTRVTETGWREADAVNPGEFLISILLPELDGGILSIPVGVMADWNAKKRDVKNQDVANRDVSDWDAENWEAKNQDIKKRDANNQNAEKRVVANRNVENRDAACGELPEIVPLSERITALCARLNGLTALRRKKNADKRLAVVFYNYPPGEGNVFGGAFLDTFASAAELLRVLAEVGYWTGSVPLTAEELREYFTSGGRCNAPQWAEEAQPQITCSLDGETWPIRGIICGNIFLGLQPLRKEAYHDRSQGPSGEYQAFYHWIREGFRADALIHFGTHGTLEFLPGKQNGMMGDCWPDRLIGSIPHFYYYYIGNPSEAMIAKRRSLATLVSYQAPPFKKSGLYGKLSELKETIAEYRESRQTAPECAETLLQNIRLLAEETGLLPAASQILTDQTLNEIDDTLYDYENSLITNGLHILNREEERGLLHALDGGYLPAGTAGDVVKNPDIFPSGRNLVQFDPRLVPTRTACQRGAAAAKLAVEKYREKTGDYPDTTAVILWGLETSRSQGETIGQILYYLGLRLKTDRGSYDDRLEIIPMAELQRPRMDVVIHICGFFRDMYPNLIDDLNEMFKKLLELGETDEENYFARNTRALARELLAEKGGCPGEEEQREVWEMAACRIFGPKAGEYGTRLTDLVRKGDWREAAQLGDTFVEDLSYGYTLRHRGKEAKPLVQKQYARVDFISQVRNNAEYELTDLDHYYEFYGGLATAVGNQKGQKPVMLVADTVGENVKVEDIRQALERGTATRLLNPAWIDGMLRHDYQGVRQIEKRFENVMGFAASTDAVDSRVFSQMTARYAGDEKIRQKMTAGNRWAYMRMMERLMEAGNRGYFHATEEELAQIRRAYLEAEGEAEE